MEEEGLRIEKLRKYKGLENLSDKEAQEIVCGLKRFARITYNYYDKIKQNFKNNNSSK